MKRFQIFHVLCLVSVLSGGQAAAQAFDGSWTVTRTGSGCRPKSPITVEIKDNRFSGSYKGGTGRHTITGAVNSDGVFEFKAKSPRDLVVFTGDLSTGKGRWKARRCKGSLKIFK